MKLPAGKGLRILYETYPYSSLFYFIRRNMVQQNIIQVVVRSGIVQEINNIPKGFGVEVIDYDSQKETPNESLWLSDGTQIVKEK